MALRWIPSALLPVILMMPASEEHNANHDAWRKELLEWRAKHAADLQKPDGWLSLAGLEWLEQGDNSFGTAAENKIHLKGARLPEHIGILRLQGETVTLAEPPGGFASEFQVAGAPAKTQVLPVIADNDKKAVHMTIGTLNMYVIRRADRFALRIKDSKSEAMREFHGLKWYEPNAAFRVKAKWIPYSPQKSLNLVTLAGTSYEAPVPGAVEFDLEGQHFRVEPVFEDDPPRLFFILRDTTSTSTTYGACRFLYAPVPPQGLTQPQDFWLDFNHLENPPCAYTPFATCPLPPPGNRLKIALPVGELRYHD